MYRARDSKLEREVAIKVLPAHLAGDADALARFEREAKAVAALSHPNILAIFDFGREGETAFAVMELLDGETLRARLEAGALPARKALEIAAQVARGLAAAHERGIVHRDLKPDNLFLTANGQVKILDFGLARQSSFADSGSQLHAAPTRAPATEPGAVLGTVGYMAPEQVRGEAADSRSDLFSLGVVLYEMLTGHRAFARDSAVETMTAILREDPPDLERLEEKLSPSVVRLVQHCLEKRPGERFQSARDLAFDLQSLASGGSASERSGRAVATDAPAGRRRLVVAVALVGAGLAAGAVLGALALRDGPAGDAVAPPVLPPADQGARRGGESQPVAGRREPGLREARRRGSRSLPAARRRHEGDSSHRRLRPGRPRPRLLAGRTVDRLPLRLRRRHLRDRRHRRVAAEDRGLGVRAGVVAGRPGAGVRHRAPGPADLAQLDERALGGQRRVRTASPGELPRRDGADLVARRPADRVLGPARRRLPARPLERGGGWLAERPGGRRLDSRRSGARLGAGLVARRPLALFRFDPRWNVQPLADSDRDAPTAGRAASPSRSPRRRAGPGPSPFRPTGAVSPSSIATRRRRSCAPRTTSRGTSSPALRRRSSAARSSCASRCSRPTATGSSSPTRTRPSS